MTTQKNIAHALDTAAARAESIDREPATGKQCWFLAGLILRSATAEVDYQDWLLNTSAILTKSEASSLIDFYLNAEKRAA